MQRDSKRRKLDKEADVSGIKLPEAEKRLKPLSAGSANADSWSIGDKTYSKADLELFPNADFQCFCCQAGASPRAEVRFKFCPRKSDTDHVPASSPTHAAIPGLTGLKAATFAILDKCFKNKNSHFRRG